MLFMLALVIISIVTELASKIMVLKGVNNFGYLHFYTMLEFTMINLVYVSLLKRYYNFITFYLVNVVFLVITFIDIKINGLNSMDDMSMTIESIILMSYSILWFGTIFKRLVYENLLDNTAFWVNSAILVYFSGNLSLFVSTNYLINYFPNRHYELWATIHSFFNITYNILLSVGFWKIKST